MRTSQQVQTLLINHSTLSSPLPSPHHLLSIFKMRVSTIAAVSAAGGLASVSAGPITRATEGVKNAYHQYFDLQGHRGAMGQVVEK